MYLGNSTKLAVALGAIAGTGLLGYVLICKKRKKSTFKVGELKSGHIHIADPANVENIIQQLIEGGHHKLQIIADFDNTLSRYALNGKKCSTTHNVLETSELLPASFKDKILEVKNIYYPIEIDPSKTVEEKKPYIIEWYTKAHNLLLECNLTQDIIQHAVQQSNLVLKEDHKWMFQTLHKNKVPLLIFSAGLGDVIEEVIKWKSKLYDNIKIVSNYMDFNHQGTMVGFRGELIHVFNKNESVIQDSNYFKEICNRTNVILLGDSVGDLHMADGANAEYILKIGYLNHNVDELLAKYKRKYDIVLVGDENLDVVNTILRHIL